MPTSCAIRPFFLQRSSKRATSDVVTDVAVVGGTSLLTIP